jgi:hypothetical protein
MKSSVARQQKHNMYFGIQNLSYLAQLQIVQEVEPAIPFPTGNYLLELDISLGSSIHISDDDSEHSLDKRGSIADIAGTTGSHYALINGAAYVSGSQPYYVSFDGINDYMGNDETDTYIEDIPLKIDTSNPFTISMWCYFTSAINGGTDGIVWCGQGDYSAGGYGNGGFSLNTMNFAGHFNAFRLNGPTSQTLTSNLTCPSGEWFQLSVTKDTTNRFSGFLNNTGSLMGSQLGDSGRRELSDKTSPLEMGRGLAGSPVYGDFSRRMSDVRVWSGALSYGEIGTVYSDTKSNYGF